MREPGGPFGWLWMRLRLPGPIVLGGGTACTTAIRLAMGLRRPASPAMFSLSRYPARARCLPGVPYCRWLPLVQSKRLVR